MTITRVYPAQWSRAALDLTELARLRYEEKWTIKRLQEHFGVGVLGLVLPRMDAVDRTDVDARSVLGADAGLADDVGHEPGAEGRRNRL